MTPSPQPTACPWCAHEAPDSADFRTHLMVEHRKSELARYVLEARAAEETPPDEEDPQSVEDDPDEEDPDEEDPDETELLAR